MPTMTKYFTILVSLAAAGSMISSSSKGRSRSPPKRPVDTFAQPYLQTAGGGRGSKGNKGGKGGKAGKGGKSDKGGKAGTWRQGTSNTTPDGRLKCFRFQRGACTGGCGKVHSCLVCNGNHGANSCPRKPAQGDAAGTAQSQPPAFE